MTGTGSLFPVSSEAKDGNSVIKCGLQAEQLSTSQCHVTGLILAVLRCDLDHISFSFELPGVFPSLACEKSLTSCGY